MGDNAEMAMIEFVDYNTTYNVAKTAKKKTTRRGRKKATAEETPATAEVKPEATAEATE